MRRCAVLLMLSGLLLLCAGNAARTAQDLRPWQPLPAFPSCRSTSHPQLPRSWRGTYLLAPFTSGQLVVAQITHDSSLGATRIALYGARRGAAEFLVTGKTTYELAPDGAAGRACRDLGDTGWRPLPDDWLAAGSQCTGSAPILGTLVDWWKTPIEPAPSTYWIWSKKTDGTPFRLIFEWPSDRLVPFSRFALSYQVSFAPIVASGLADLALLCKRTASLAAAQGPEALAARLDAMSSAPARADAALERLMPALEPSCPAPNELRWPERLAITGLLTPFDAAENPVPTEVLYDWSVPGQRTRIFSPPHSGPAAQDALLLGDGGYTISYRGAAAASCIPGLPGTIRPDWPARAPCACEAAIKAGTPLSPNEATRILSCPLAPPRNAWAWYGLSGRPSLFMVTSLRADAGKGDFAGLDYVGWMAHRRVPRSAFDRPPRCTVPPAAGGMQRAPSHCSTCHTAASTK